MVKEIRSFNDSHPENKDTTKIKEKVYKRLMMVEQNSGQQPLYIKRTQERR